MGFNIILRNAEISDLKILENWDEQPHVLASDPDDEWNWKEELLRHPEWREQLIAELDGVPIGVIQIIDAAEEDSHYWGDVPSGIKAIDIWIGDVNNLGKGYGTIMMIEAIERCFKDEKTNSILIDPLASNKKAHRFYERFGFTFVSEQRFNEDDCFVYQLTRQDWEQYKKQKN
ncbi:MAG: GNAT family N-acetyltransferase [Bacteroidota bacterium]|nr:GNAT family N-acetyltransferase [Bacteroidota bacterium]